MQGCSANALSVMQEPGSPSLAWNVRSPFPALRCDTGVHASCVVHLDSHAICKLDLPQDLTAVQMNHFSEAQFRPQTFSSVLVFKQYLSQLFTVYLISALLALCSTLCMSTSAIESSLSCCVRLIFYTMTETGFMTPFTLLLEVLPRLDF